MISDELIAKIKDSIGEPAGKCYIASEALYYLAGGKTAGLTPVRGALPGDLAPLVHWWLRDSEGNVIDLTADQFDFDWPYEDGRGCGFQSNMKKETKELLEVINGKET